MKLASRQGPLPFWIHQVAEYAIAAVLASSGARSPKPVLPLACAVVVLLLAATADGPLAAVHAVKRPQHRYLDWGVGAGLLAAAAAFAGIAGTVGSVMTGLAGLAVLGLSWQSNYELKPVKVKGKWVIEREMKPSKPSKSPKPTTAVISRGARAEQVGRKAGKYAAVGAKVWRNRKS